MGWIRDGAYDHEGWVANVLDDGRAAGGATGGGVIVHELTDADRAAHYEVRRYEGSDHVEVVIPWDCVVTWRVTCQCGWTGSELTALVEKNGRRGCPEDSDDEAYLLAEWRAHVAPFAALTDIEDLADEQSRVAARLDDAVQLAREAGASWSQIGRATHLSKQGAQQRWNELATG